MSGISEANETSRLLGNQSSQNVAELLPLETTQKKKSFYFISRKNTKGSAADDNTPQGQQGGDDESEATETVTPTSIFPSWVTNFFTPNSYRPLGQKPRKVQMNYLKFANE